MDGTQDSSEIREVAAGTEFRVELTAPGGTGYHWHVMSTPPGVDVVREEPRGTNPRVRTAAGGPTDTGPANTGASGTVPTPGSPIAQRFVLRADREAAVVFGLTRSWEREPVRTHTVTVRFGGHRTPDQETG